MRTGLLLCTHRFSIRLFFSSKSFFSFFLLTVFSIRVTAMRVKEADIQEKWPRVTQRSLEKFTSQVFHVCYVTAALQQIAVQFGVGKVKWINLKREKQCHVTMGLPIKPSFALNPPPPNPPLLSIVTEFEKPTNLIHPSRSITNLLSTLFRLQNIGTCLAPFPIFQATETPNIEMKHTLACMPRICLETVRI